MKYFIVTLVYELMDVEEYPVYKNYVVDTNDQITLADLLHSPKYQMEGYRMVGVFNLEEITKTTAESLLILQKNTPPTDLWAVMSAQGRHG